MPADRGRKSFREQTDRSLDLERKRSDVELLERSEALAEDSDQLIRKAREHAADVLARSRDREDEHLAQINAPSPVREQVAGERDAADTALETERAAVDANRLDERERRRLAMIQLLALEREATDHTLETERAIADRNLSAHEDVLSGVAHDLRNLISVLVLNATTITLAPDLATAIPLAETIRTRSAQLNVLLEDLLDFSNMQAGTLAIRALRTDLVTLVRDVVAIHGPVAEANRVELKLACALDTAILEADPRRLTRVVTGLIGNALKFTPAGGRILVHIKRFDRGVDLDVSDNGPGIPESELEAIFERYRQTGDGNRTSGVGLGLFIARAIVEAHGGRIWAENKVGGGALFRVRLPYPEPAKN